MFNPEFIRRVSNTAVPGIEAVGDGLAAYYGNVIGPALQLPGKIIQGAISPGQNPDVFLHSAEQAGREAFIPGLMQIFGGNPGGAMGTLGSAMGRNQGEAWASYILGQQVPKTQDPASGLSAAVAPDWAGELGKSVGELATDPLTYVGHGLFGPGEKILQSGINKALLAPALVPKAALDVPIPGIGNYLKRTVINPATDAVETIGAKSIGDYLWGGPGRRANLHNYSQDIQNITDRLINSGHDLDFDIADLLNGRTSGMFGRFDPSNPTANLGNFRNSVIQAYRDAAAKSPQHAQALADAINEFARETRNAGLSGENLHRRAGSMAEAAQHVLGQIDNINPDQVQNIFRRRIAALDYLSHGQTGILADLPDQLRTRGEIAFGAMSQHGRALQQGREQLEAGIRNLWELQNARQGGALGDYVPVNRASSSQDLLTQINDRLNKLGIQPLAPTDKDPMSAQLVSRLQGLIDPLTHNRMTDVLKTWGASGDPLTENAYRLVMDKTIRDKAIELGLDPNKAGMFSGLDKFSTFWKTIQLMSPKYLLGNLGSGMVMSQMAGVDGQQIGQNFARNLWNMLRGNPLTLPELAQQNKLLGLPEHYAPAGIQESAGLLQDNTTLRDIAGKGQDILSKIGTLPMMAGGAVLGAAGGYQRSRETPEDDLLSQTLLGTGVGAATFGSMPVLSRRFYQPIAQGTEQVLRSGAFTEGRSRFLESQLPQLVDIVESRLGQPLPQRAVDLLKQTRGLMSEQNLDTLLTRLNIDPSIRTQALGDWRNVLHQADQSGVDLSNHINFDYKNLNNFEEFARQVFPFSTWATKAMPFFAQRVAEHPLIGSTIARFEQDAGQDNRSRGLSPRFAGTTEVPGMSDIWATLTGRPGSHAFFNPLKDLFPAADAQRAASFEPPDNATAYQHLQRVLDIIGLSTHPVLDLAMRMANQDPGSPAQGVSLRQAGPVQALTGIDLSSLPRQLEATARQALGQEEPANGRDQATLRRIDELALQKTGFPITSQDPQAQAVLAPYIRSKYDRTGPIWQEAQVSTDRERGARSAAGFVFPFVIPQATLSPEEARISEARAAVKIDPHVSQAIRDNARSQPQSVADPDTVRHISESARRLGARIDPSRNGELPPDVQAYLNVPTWENLALVQKKMYDAQSQLDPAARGYSGSGSAEKQRLQQAFQTYMNIPAAISNRPEFARWDAKNRQDLVDILDTYEQMPGLTQRSMLRTMPHLAAALAAAKQEREAMVRQSPSLAAYLDYRKENPQGSLDDFLTNVYPNQRRGS